MTTSKPKTEAFLVTSTDEDLHEMRGVQLMEHHDPSCVNTQFRYEPLIRRSDYETLQSEIDHLRKDAARLDWMENQARLSPTGISFDYVKHVEDGRVLNRGYRFMRRHFISGDKDTLRRAIDAVMEGDGV